MGTAQLDAGIELGVSSTMSAMSHLLILSFFSENPGGLSNLRSEPDEAMLDN
jgi:hypothetical protein